MSPSGLDIVSPQALGTDIEYSLRNNTLSAKSILGGRVALTWSLLVVFSVPLGCGTWRSSEELRRALSWFLHKTLR